MKFTHLPEPYQAVDLQFDWGVESRGEGKRYLGQNNCQVLSHSGLQPNATFYSLITAHSDRVSADVSALETRTKGWSIISSQCIGGSSAKPGCTVKFS